MDTYIYMHARELLDIAVIEMHVTWLLAMHVLEHILLVLLGIAKGVMASRMELVGRSMGH
jgi:hypothetical protein